MPVISETDKQTITDLILDSADAAKEYWFSPIGSVQEATAKNKIKSLVDFWITFAEEQR